MPPTDADTTISKFLAPGRLFEQKYRIISQIGTGSFAEVLKAHHEVMGRDVALKCLKPAVLRANPEVSARFVNEVRIVSRLRHPNTVTIFDFGESSDGLAYMVLEYLEGETLDAFIARNGPIEQARAFHICRQILKSLDEAHAHGIIHRDLKPSNLMLIELHGEPDFVKVLDFGVAKLLNEPSTKTPKDGPRSTQFIGTPIYMSPEQVLGQSVTAASDLYSLGLLLYQMLSGRPPIAHESVAAVVREHLDPGPLPLNGLEQFSPQVQRLIRKATQRTPEERFQSVGAFMAAMPMDPADMSSEGLRILSSAGRLDAATPTPAPQAVESLEEDPTDSGIFSGRNYIELPEPEPAPRHSHERRHATPSRRGREGVSSRRRPTPAERPRPNTPAPTPRTDELALDLGALERQRRQLERNRRRPTPAGGGPTGSMTARNGAAGALRTRPPGAGHMEEKPGIGAVFSPSRVILYVFSLILGYIGFVLLGATLYEEAVAVRWAACLAVPMGALLSSRFSAMRAVSGDIAQRWLSPTARNLIVINLLVLLLVLFVWPAQTAAGLGESPTWFLQALPGAAPFSWVDLATLKIAERVAPIFHHVSLILPY